MSEENYIEDYVPKPAQEDNNIFYVNSSIVEDAWRMIKVIIPSSGQLSALSDLLTLLYYICVYSESMTLKALGIPRSISRALVPWPGYNYAT